MTFWHRLMLTVCWGWKKPVFWTVESWRGSSPCELRVTCCVQPVYSGLARGVFYFTPFNKAKEYNNSPMSQERKRQKTLRAQKLWMYSIFDRVLTWRHSLDPGSLSVVYLTFGIWKGWNTVQYWYTQGRSVVFSPFFKGVNINCKSTEIRFQIISVNFNFKNIYVSVTDIGLRIFWQQYNYEKSFCHVLILHILSFNIL